VSTDNLDFQILSLLEDAGGMMSLDQLLVGLYKSTGKVYKRQAITSQLYRMAHKGLTANVPEKKGVYALAQVSTE
jgi:hypothetical protein